MSALWTRIFEPLFRHWPSYPPDWEHRRMLVFERASSRCETCGLPAGRIVLCGKRWRVAGAHVHHVIPIARGGRHALTNLVLLCAQCHGAEHPENAELAPRARR